MFCRKPPSPSPSRSENRLLNLILDILLAQSCLTVFLRVMLMENLSRTSLSFFTGTLSYAIKYVANMTEIMMNNTKIINIFNYVKRLTQTKISQNLILVQIGFIVRPISITNSFITINKKPDESEFFEPHFHSPRKLREVYRCSSVNYCCV